MSKSFCIFCLGTKTDLDIITYTIIFKYGGKCLYLTILWFQVLSPESRSVEMEIKDQTLRQFMLSQYDSPEENSAKVFDEFGMKRSVLKVTKWHVSNNHKYQCCCLWDHR